MKDGFTSVLNQVKINQAVGSMPKSEGVNESLFAQILYYASNFFIDEFKLIQTKFGPSPELNKT